MHNQIDFSLNCKIQNKHRLDFHLIQQNGELTICIGNVIGATESGNNYNAHDHEEIVGHWDVDLPHRSLGGVNYLHTWEAAECH